MKKRSEVRKAPAPMEPREDLSASTRSPDPHGVPSANLAKASTAGGISKANVEKLEQAEQRISALLADGLSMQWQLGQALLAAHKANVWKFRTNESGRPVYKNFGAWAADRCNVSRSYGNSLMLVAATYTEQQIRAVGASKLTLALRLPEAIRPAPEALTTVSARQLEAQVQAERPAKRPSPANEVTVAIAPQEARIPLFTASGERTKRVTPQFGEHRLGPDLVANLELHHDENGELEILVEYRRAAIDTTAEAAK